MKKGKNYYLGLDIGTDSVGYAATDEQYTLLKFRGEPVWGSMIFDAGQLSAERRSFRSARRRLDRRQQRVALLQEIFAKEIAKVDERFFIRLQESYKWREDTQDPYIFFNDKDYTDKQYHEEYPTIHHLIVELMKSDEPHDVRLVYLACAWLVAHRGHFLSNLDVSQLERLKDVGEAYQDFCHFFADREYRMPFEGVDIEALGSCLKAKTGINAKKSELTAVLLHGQKASKELTEELPYSTDAMIRLLAGGTVKLKDIFGKAEYAEQDPDSISLGMDEEKFAALMANIGEDYDLIERLRAIYDWAMLADTLGEYDTVSEAKNAVYEMHKKDLKLLKYFIRKYVPEKYNEMFRKAGTDNYVAYSYHMTGLSEEEKAKVGKKGKKGEKAKPEVFLKYVKSIVQKIKPDEADAKAYDKMMQRIDAGSFLPKQRNTDNRVIPQQLYQQELRIILAQASGYLPFLNEKDADGFTAKEKIISIFLYKLPYFVGPLNPASEFSWVKRTAEKITPWNYEQIIDFDASEDSFIRRMTNTCTYLAGEKVLPKDSLCYQRFMVLNEINNIRINNERIPVELKQQIYHELFEKKKKVRRKEIEEYLICNQAIAADERDSISGIDIEIKSSLSSLIAFRRFLNEGILSEEDVENIIERASYAEDKSRVKKWLQKNYPQLSEADCSYISRIRIKDFGRLSRAFLTEIEGTADFETGEITSILGAMWNTNYNLMELLSDRFGFMAEIESRRSEYYSDHPRTLEKRLDEMYVSNSVRRSIYRTLDIVNDIRRALGDPTKIFIEMTRGGDSSMRGKRTATRRQQIEQIYEKCSAEDVRELKHQLEALGEKVDNRLQSDRLFLYFMQFGRCAYSNMPIDLQQLMSGSKEYDIDHIYPQAFVKDDSIINNKVLVLSKINGAKENIYPIAATIRDKMSGIWTHWHKIGTISEEKYKRLTRKTPFTDEERYGFINRQLTETSQATKAVAELLKEKFPEAEIIYTRARLTSEFRHEFNLPKSRLYNDLHHAVDAYLNIVTGNVYHMKFSRRYFSLPADHSYSIKAKTIFTHPLYCNGTLVWDGNEMLSKVIKTAKKNHAHFIKFSFYKGGGLFDQMPVRKGSGLVPLKAGMQTEKYGGYDKPGIMFFLPVRYRIGKKSDIIVMPVELLYGKQVLASNEYAEAYAYDRLARLLYGKQVLASDEYADAYAYDRLARLLGKKIDEVSFPFGMRPWKINTMLSLDGFRVCITGTSSGGKMLIVQPVIQFSAGEAWKKYISRLEHFVEKNKKNPNYIYDAEYDAVTAEKNIELYDLFTHKAVQSIYNKRPTLQEQILIDGREKFLTCNILQQCEVLLEILSIFGKAKGGHDLRLIGGSQNNCSPKISSTISNWKKNYTDVRIIDQSPSGLWEVQSDNLLEKL